jgi:hypothetical protein
LRTIVKNNKTRIPNIDLLISQEFKNNNKQKDEDSNNKPFKCLLFYSSIKNDGNITNNKKIVCG